MRSHVHAILLIKILKPFPHCFNSITIKSNIDCEMQSRLLSDIMFTETQQACGKILWRCIVIFAHLPELIADTDLRDYPNNLLPSEKHIHNIYCRFKDLCRVFKSGYSTSATGKQKGNSHIHIN